MDKGIQERLFKQFGRDPIIEKIAEKMEMDKEDVVMALEASYHPEYLHSIIHQSDGSPLYLIDKISNEPEESRDMVDNIVLKDMLSGLKPRERQIIILRYFKDQTKTEVARQLGISQVQVSRIEKKIIENMRKNLAKA